MIPYAACLLLGCAIGYLAFYFTAKKKEKVDSCSRESLSSSDYDSYDHDYSHDMSSTLHRRGAHIPMMYEQAQQQQNQQQIAYYGNGQQHHHQHHHQHGVPLPTPHSPLASVLPRPYVPSHSHLDNDNVVAPHEVLLDSNQFQQQQFHLQDQHQQMRQQQQQQQHQNQQHQSQQHQSQQHQNQQHQNQQQPQQHMAGAQQQGVQDQPNIEVCLSHSTHTTPVNVEEPPRLQQGHGITTEAPLHTVYPPPPLPPPPLQQTSPLQNKKGRLSPRRRRSTGTVTSAIIADDIPSRQDTPEIYQNSTVTPSRSRTGSFTTSSVSSISSSSSGQMVRRGDSVVNAYQPQTEDRPPLEFHLHPDLPLPAQVQPPIPAESVNRSFPDSQFVSLNMKDIELISIIGGGAFGQVWKGVWQGTPVAVKVLSSACQTDVPASVIQAFQDEVQMLARLRHPNICLFLGACLEPPCRTIVTEIVSRGSLWDALRTPHLFEERGRGDIFHWPWWTIRRVLDGTCRGLVYLHGNKPPIIHRDLKSANLLLDDSFNVKICDFGLARLRDFTSTMTANVGTAQWTAPEVLAGKEYNESADMYSLGIVAWELLTGRCPYDHTNNQVEIAVNVAHHKIRPTLSDRCPKQVRDYIENCWSDDPKSRMSAREALKQLETVIPVI